MSGTSEALTVDISRPRLRVKDWLDLTKARLSALVLVTVAFGFLLAPSASKSLSTFALTLLGIAFVAAGASALNQYIERDLDRLMDRTKQRPIPAGRIEPMEALLFGVLISIAGILLLMFFVNVMTAFLSAMSLATYVFVYTPLKMRTSFHTLIGAVTGALPPVMGWAAVTGTVSEEAWILFSILFVWQLPHFFAIAWVYRDDYGKAGMQMLSVVDADGRVTLRQVFLLSLVLLPVSLLPAAAGMAGSLYALTALVLGLIFVAFAGLLYRTKSREDARSLYFVSLIYLPTLFGMLFIDKGVSL